MKIRNLTEKQVAFARAYVKNGGNAAAAIGDAYDHVESTPSKSRSSHGLNLLNNEAILEYIEDLKQIESEIAQVDRSVIISELLQNSRLARAKGDIAASNRALELAGKGIPGGMFTDRTAVEQEQPETEESILERMRELQEAFKEELKPKLSLVTKDEET